MHDQDGMECEHWDVKVFIPANKRRSKNIQDNDTVLGKGTVKRHIMTPRRWPWYRQVPLRTLTDAQMIEETERVTQSIIARWERWKGICDLADSLDGPVKGAKKNAKK